MTLTFLLNLLQVSFLQELLGTDQYGHFFVALLFAYVGALVSLLIHSTERDKDSPRTPFKFDLGFLLSDNAKRCYLNIILLFLFVRFFPNFNNNEEITYYTALLTGVGVDKLLELFRNLSFIDRKGAATTTVKQ